jgi:serine/threonine protein phosphatase PrpC
VSPVRIGGCSETGSRSHNEDVVAFGQTAHGAWYAVLADGAGGHRRGEEAAQRAVRSIETLLVDVSVGYSPENLSQIVRLAHLELLNNQGSQEESERMHCTIVVLWIAPGGERVLWTHVGDSRLYRIRHGSVDVVTSDDSVVQRMMEAGMIRPDQMRDHPRKNQLLAALGMTGEVEPHTVVRPVELQDGDAFLLCSDGWWDNVEPEFLAQGVMRASDPEQWLAEMRESILARANPRQDNFSAIAVWVGNPKDAAEPGIDDTTPGTLPVPL